MADLSGESPPAPDSAKSPAVPPPAKTVLASVQGAVKGADRAAEVLVGPRYLWVLGVVLWVAILVLSLLNWKGGKDPDHWRTLLLVLVSWGSMVLSYSPWGRRGVRLFHGISAVAFLAAGAVCAALPPGTGWLYWFCTITLFVAAAGSVGCALKRPQPAPQGP